MGEGQGAVPYVSMRRAGSQCSWVAQANSAQRMKLIAAGVHAAHGAAGQTTKTQVHDTGATPSQAEHAQAVPQRSNTEASIYTITRE